MKKKRKPQGSSGMTAKGLKPVQLWLTPDEHAAIKDAARYARRPMTQFILATVLGWIDEVVAAKLECRPKKQGMK